jgi:hypothetical protein
MGDAVAKELEASSFGIICVTRENVQTPWVLFEAGALAKSLEGARVIPLLLDLDFRDITGPLAQFQAKKVEKPGVEEVIDPSIERHLIPIPKIGPDPFSRHCGPSSRHRSRRFRMRRRLLDERDRRAKYSKNW